MKHLYTVDKAPDGHHYVSKVSVQCLAVETVYNVTQWRKYKHCDCIAGYNKRWTCRHRQMVDLFIKDNKVGSGSLYDYDRTSYTNYSLKDYEKEE
jgi:hypothetical protein